MRSRMLLALLPPAAVVGYAIWKWPSLVSAGRALANADLTWLAVGACAIALTYAAGAASQQGAVALALPRRQLFVSQLAGVCVNAFLPAGLGAALVSHRFLRRRGLSAPDAFTALALTSVAGAIIHATALVSLCLIAPDRLPVCRPDLGTPHVLVLSVVAAAVVGSVAWVLASARGSVLRARVREQVAAVRATLTDRRQALLLWGGSAAGPLLHTVTVTAVLHAIGRPLPVLDVLVAYLAASAAAALVPSPGSVGSLDILLGLTLTGVGADPQTAVTAVLGYRLLATWLPLLPSALALAHLHGGARAHPRRDAALAQAG
ncbi:lysylphosphatidylglycerol synthase transmembrane domain-containing protein [Phytohabitans sp. LJ34]|uniref:lysylphosphatidylglycerol synthase transmembrane domain-containing protein n=1 Tax=Phytohabitans sp. LJ34 TaxID=3452217 RepID=UPI003F8CE369